MNVYIWYSTNTLPTQRHIDADIPQQQEQQCYVLITAGDFNIHISYVDIYNRVPKAHAQQ